ncbi:MAG: hypothetical protein ABIS92_00675 [Polyangia bacterium]
MILGFRSPTVAVALVRVALIATSAPWWTATAAPGVQDEAAQQAFRAGVDAAHQEHWVEARGQFEKAYGLSPRPVVLINLAGAQARTGKLLEAAQNYRRILDDEPSPETASFRKAAAETLPALEARIPRIRLRPSGLTPLDVIQIDGDTVAVEAAAGGHPLDPGEHTLVVQHAGSERARVLFTLTERELRYISLPLPALIPALPPPSLVDLETSSSGNGTTPAARASDTLRPWWKSPWTWTAAGVLVAGAAVTTYLIINSQRQDPFAGNISPGRIEVR